MVYQFLYYLYQCNQIIIKMKIENQQKFESFNRDRDRLIMIKTLFNQMENSEPIVIAKELEDVRIRIEELFSKTIELKKIDLGIDVVEKQLKQFVISNNLDWIVGFDGSYINIRIGFHELMHEGMMSKFCKIFDFELEEYEDDDCETRYSYLVTDVK